MTLNISSNQIEVKNAVGTTKFNGDDKLMYLRHVQSGNMPRVPNISNPSGHGDYSGTFQQGDWGVSAALTTTIDPAKDVIELSAALTQVYEAQLVPGYNGAYIPMQGPIPISVTQSGGVGQSFMFLNGGVGLSKVTFNVLSRWSSSGNLAVVTNEPTDSKNLHTNAFINNPNFSSGPMITDTIAIVEVDWELKVWRYQN